MHTDLRTSLGLSWRAIYAPVALARECGRRDGVLHSSTIVPEEHFLQYESNGHCEE